MITAAHAKLMLYVVFQKVKVRKVKDGLRQGRNKPKQSHY